MQRQSLGSPGAKPLIPFSSSTAARGPDREEKRKSISSAARSAAAAAAVEADKLSRASPRANRWIHLIPALTVLCLLVLYLFSHEPSLEDSQTLGGSFLRLDSKEAASAIHQSGRGLKAAAAGGRLRHRKLGCPWPTC